MKIFTNILKVIFTVLLTLVIIPIELATMSLFAVNRAMSPEALSKTIKEITFAVIEMDRNDTNSSKSAELCSKDFIATVSGDASQSEIEQLFDKMITELNIKYNETTGVFTFGKNGSIDIAGTGILPYLETNLSEEDVYNIIYSSKISDIISDYAADVINAFFTGENIAFEITEDECMSIAGSAIDAMNTVLETPIPEKVKQNFMNEINESISELVTIINDTIPDGDEIKTALAVDSDIDLDVLNATFAAFSIIFSDGLLITLCCIIAILAIILILLHFKNKFGILWLSLINILNGLLFFSVGGIFNYELVSQIISNVTNVDAELKLFNAILSVVSTLLGSLKIAGAVVLGIGVALLILYIVLKIVSAPKYYERDTESI